MLEEIVKAIRSMETQRVGIEGKMQQATARRDTLRLELEQIESDLSELTSELTEFQDKQTQLSNLFPEEAAAAKNNSVVSAPVVAKPTRVATTKTTSRRPNTIVDNMRMVMGDKVMNAGELKAELTLRGLDRKSSDFQSYISTLLSSHDVADRDEFGQQRVVDGKRLRVKVFELVTRGHYRVKERFLWEDQTVTMSATNAQEVLQDAPKGIVEPTDTGIGY